MFLTLALIKTIALMITKLCVYYWRMALFAKGTSWLFLVIFFPILGFYYCNCNNFPSDL